MGQVYRAWDIKLNAAQESMGNAATLVSPASNQRMPVAGAILLGLAAVLALGFVAMFALPYSTLDETTFGRFWPKRGWLLTHMAGGMVALLVGPVQIWLGLTRRRMALHRVLGKVYLAAVVVGGISSFGLSLTTEAGWMLGMGLAFLGLAWFVTTGMALAAVLRRRFELHKEWMIRSYVVTFAFVNFRIFAGVTEAMGVGTELERLAAASWFCWAVPLLVTEVLLQARRTLAPSRAT